MDSKKQAIIAALRNFVSQRPGFDPRNYGDYASYRSESRAVTRDKADALQLLRDIELRDSITADMILKECGGGRLQIEVREFCPNAHAPCTAPIVDYRAKVHYTTGQYWCVEYRRAVARLCASVLWAWKREHCLPDILNPKKAGFN